jgi:hypothetical protein
MATGRRIARTIGAALVGAAMLMPASSARAGGCDLGDLLNAFQDTLNTLDSTACAGVTADPALWTPVGAAAGVMAGISQSQQFCQQVQNAQNQLTNVQGDGNSLVTQLNNLGIDASFLSSVLGVLGSAGDALSVVECACGLSNNITQLGGDLGSCIQNAVCAAQNEASQLFPGVFDPCSETVVSVPAQCTQNPCNASTGVCDPNLAGNAIISCPPGDDAPPVWQQNGPNGGTVVSTPGGYNPSTGVVSIDTCVCPAPMSGNWANNSGYAEWSNIVSDPACRVFVCTCPPGTTPASNTGAGQYVCVCQNTGLPTMAGYGATIDNPCPGFLTGLPCPKGQINFNGKCVTPCTSSSEVMTPDGTCCNPNQETMCGQCCPAGMVPNPATGTCTQQETTQ